MGRGREWAPEMTAFLGPMNGPAMDGKVPCKTKALSYAMWNVVLIIDFCSLKARRFGYVPKNS